jgi:nucleoside-diphosphate-sugar epimerase
MGAIVRALRARRYFGVGRGAARRSMVLASDAARGLRDLAASGGVFHLTDGRHPSFAELEAALARALGRRTPRHLPLWAARLGAWVGDGAEQMTGRSLALNSRTLAKMTATLTFCDQRARDQLVWNPAPVVERIREIFA